MNTINKTCGKSESRLADVNGTAELAQVLLDSQWNEAPIGYLASLHPAPQTGTSASLQQQPAVKSTAITRATTPKKRQYRKRGAITMLAEAVN